MSSSSDSDLPEWVSDALPTSTESKDAVTAFFEDPRGWVTTLIAGWIVNNVFLRPVLTLLDMGAAALAVVENYYAWWRHDWQVAGVHVLDAVLGSVATVRLALVTVVTEAGLAAPIAVMLVNVVLVVLLVTVVVLIGRVVIDAIPGGGAFL